MLRSGEQTIDLGANLDTGAAYCLFERSYAEALGIEVARGRSSTFLHDVRVGKEERQCVNFYGIVGWIA